MSGSPLYLDRKAAAAELARQHGFEVTPEQSARAQLDLMYRNEAFRERAEALYSALEAADVPERREEVIRTISSTFEAFNDHRLGPELVEKLAQRSPYTNVSAEVSGAGPYARYAYKLRIEDVETLQSWIQEIRQIAAGIEKLLGNPQQNPELHDQTLKVLGPSPESQSVLRYALALFLNDHRARWLKVVTPIRAFIARLVGGLHPIITFGKKPDFCADTATIGRLLSDELGMRAQISNATASELARIRKGYHQYLVFEDGSIIDPYLFPHLQGYLADPSRYEDEVQAGGKILLK